jgi:radical SAM protein with 4Fe4S-binding SPASM domain
MGGEPTCYNNLLEAINIFKKHNISTALVTNGIRLADKSLVLQLQQAGLTRINLSLKGYDSDNYINVTGVDRFHTVLEAIKNLSKIDFPYCVSMVLSSDNIYSFIKGVLATKDAGAKHFSFSFHYDFAVLNNGARKEKEYNFNENVFDIIEGFINQYSELCRILKDDFTLSQSFPFCAWPEEFLLHMANKHQLKSICQLLKHNGLIFDVDFRVIPCNAMYQITLGKFGEDFNTSNDFEDFWRSTEVEKIFNKLRSLPSIKCKSCKWLSICGGGCISHWFNFRFNEFEQARDSYYSKKI